MPKVIGIIGSRRRDGLSDLAKTEKALKEVYEVGDTLVSGGCPQGGDRFAEVLAKQLHIPITIHKAQWDLYGKRAGFVRNTYIADDADVMIAVVAQDRTGGTEDTITKFNGTLILV